MVVAGDWAVQTRKMLHPQTIEIVPDLPTLAVRAAEEFILLVEEALRKGGLFSVALAGGSTPQQMYTRLSQASLSWDRIYFFWGDERCVPPDHPDSNYRMAYEALLKSIPVPQNNIFRIHGEFPVKQAAQKYEEDLHFFLTGIYPNSTWLCWAWVAMGTLPRYFQASPPFTINRIGSLPLFTKSLLPRSWIGSR